MPADRIEEATKRIRNIRDELLALDSRDPQVISAVEHVNGALTVVEGNPKEPARMIDHLKAAGEALVQTGNYFGSERDRDSNKYDGNLDRFDRPVN